MIIVHTLWTDATLHVWGERCAEADSSEWTTNENGKRDTIAPNLFSAVEPERLRSVLGDVLDALLVSGGRTAELLLSIPHRNNQPLPSTAFDDKESLFEDKHELSLQRCRVPTLVYSPADAVDLLTGVADLSQENLRVGASLRYWSKMAAFVLELLAKQHFVPAIHLAGEDRSRGYWRAIVEGEGTADRLRAFLAAMPPVCRSVVTENGMEDATTILETFLWTTVDALVRRCLDGDDLAHAIHDRSAETDSQLLRWLRSLVGPDAALQGSPEACAGVHRTVHEWLSKLDLMPDHRTYRSCFKLSPPALQPAGASATSLPWRLTLHVQDMQRPERIVDAATLIGSDEADEPRILKRPFDDALIKLRADLGQAARHFPPIAPCAEPAGPVEVNLTLHEAYTFLRDAAPILELEGFGVWLPSWWKEDRPRLRMWLDLQPVDSASPTENSEIGLESVVGFDWRVAVGDDGLTFDELSHLAEMKVPLVQVRGRWTEVQSAEIKSALSFLETRRHGRITLFEALRLCFTADDLDTGLPVAGIRSTGWIEQLLGETQTHRTLQPLDPPTGFCGTLRPYQLRGLEWLHFLSRLGLGACLADDMGLGKTIQLIALFLHERQENDPPGPTLLVVPMSLVGNWQREIEKFGPGLDVMIHHGTERLSGREFVEEVAKHDVVISTYGLIYRDLEHLEAVDWHRVALDEAQNIKNPAAKQAIALRSLRAVHRIALTGTPVENRLSDLWSIMDFLNAGYLGTATEFRRRFAVPIERHHDRDRAGRLRHIIRPFLLRRLKSDPLIEVDLPDKMEMKVYCNLTREQAALYQAVVDDMLGHIDGTGGIQRRGMILAALVKLKQVCNHPVQFLKDSTSLPHRSGKCDRLTEMLEEVVAEGDHALIFTQFRRMAELLDTLLREQLKCEVLLLHGGTSRKNRDLLVERFQDETEDTPLLILSLKAGGYGLNLTAANHVFHFDRWWNPAVEEQATDRAHRIGQVQRVQVHKFLCIGTLEERIDALLEKKKNMADNIVGSGEEWLTELSTDKLREVLQLSRDAVAEP